MIQIRKNKKKVLILFCLQLIIIFILAYYANKNSKYANQKTIKEYKDIHCITTGNCGTRQQIAQVEPPYFSEKIKKLQPNPEWSKNDMIERLCEDKVIIHYKQFAQLKEVMFNPSGGPNTPNSDTTRKQHAAWELDCEGTPVLMSELTADNVPMLQNISGNKSNKENAAVKKKDVATDLVVTISRGTNVYFYGHIADLFNIFTMIVIYQKQVADVVVLAVDTHGGLYIDEPLQLLFGPVIRGHQLTQSKQLDNVIFPLNTDQNPLRQQHKLTAPYLKEFRDYVLQQYMVMKAESPAKRCNKITVTILWQRNSNHVPVKALQGKILNEAELVAALQNRLPRACVRGYLIEILPVQEQLEIIYDTDILVAMNGDVLNHVIFMSPGTGVVEMLPYRAKKRIQSYTDYGNLCEGLGLHYTAWENMNEAHDMPNYFTIVNATAVADLVYGMAKNMCSD